MSTNTEERDEPEVGFDAEMVERRARIFRFGHFPAKNRGLGWTCTREDFVAFNGESGTVPIGVDPVRRKHYFGEPRGSIFDGRTGKATFTVEGDEVYAMLRTPPMVMESALEHGMKISSVFRSATDKTLTKVDLVDTPHFDDAIIFEGEAGEVIVSGDDEPEEVEFCGGSHHEAYQTMHDLCSHGRSGLCSGRVGFAREKKETGDDRLFRQMHHHAVHMGAYCPGMPDGMHEEIGMSDEPDDDIEGQDGEPDPVAFDDETPREKAMRLRMEKLEAQLTQKDAVAFAREVTTGKDARVLPAMRKKIEEGYAQAASVDAAIPEPVTFTEGTSSREGTHVEAFKSLILALPRLGIVGPKVAGSPAEVAFTALDMEPDEGADHAKKEEEAREARRKQNHEYASRHNPAAR